MEDHPAQSPDLNPIELVWAKVKAEVEAKQLRTKEEQKRAKVESWNGVSLPFIRICIDHFSSLLRKNSRSSCYYFYECACRML